MKYIIIPTLFLLTCCAVTFASNQPNTSGNTTPPQISPNIVLTPNLQTRKTIAQLFDPKAAYHYFEKYDSLKLFPIPTKDDES